MKKRNLLTIFTLLALLLFLPLNVKASDYDDEDCDYYAEYGDHNWDPNETCTKIDANYHQYSAPCLSCGITGYTDKIAHSFTAQSSYKKCDSKNHYVLYKCNDCGCTKYVTKAHSFKFSKVVKWAEPGTKGRLQYKCSLCGYTYTKSVTWSYAKVSAYADGYASYDIKSHSLVYGKSKSIWVKTYSYGPGYVVKVKIGGKTYSKKMTGSKTVINIKKPSIGSKVTIRIYYKGRCVGKDCCGDSYDDYVWYANKVKVGMTKTQVRWTWGKPKRTSSASGGWAYWYWNDGSRVTFKKGKVKSWYDASN